MSERGVRCMWMRGGTSKGGYFLAEDLPQDPAERDGFLLRGMGSPDARQIDGMGGADPLTSKVAVVRKSARPGVDVDYLFLQVFVDQSMVTDSQNCGNILAGVGAFAIERGLVDAKGTRQRSASSWRTPARSRSRRSLLRAGASPTMEMPASTGCPARPLRCRLCSRIRPARPAAPCSRPATGRRHRGHRRHAHR